MTAQTMVREAGLPEPDEVIAERATTLHVIQGGPCLIAFVAELARTESAHTLLVGTRADECLARSLGLDPVAAFAPPFGELTLAIRSWRRLLKLVQAEYPSIESATCWSTSCAAATVRAMPRWDVALASAGGPEPGVATALMARFVSFRPGAALAMTEAGASASRAFVDNEVTVIRPTVRQSLIHRNREKIRRRWWASEREIMVGLLGEPADAADARRASDIVGIAAVRGLKTRLLIHPESSRANRTLQWISEVDVPSFIGIEQALARPWEVVAGLDAAIVLRDSLTVAGGASRTSRLLRCGSETSISPLPACWAAEAGVPILAERGALDDGLAAQLRAFVFDADDPLSATRELLAVAKRSGVTPR